MKAIIALTAAALSFIGTIAHAQGVQQVTPDYKVVEHGRSIELGHFYSYDPDCRSRGLATINLTSQPQGGQVETQAGRAYPAYPNSNIRFQCNRRRLPAVLVYYHAAPNFTGTDSFTAEVVFPGGVARQYRYTVEVR